MSGYTPLFSSLTTGTLCGKWPDIGLWAVVLSQADRRGMLDVTPDFLALITGLPVDEVVACMARFCQPDPRSRSKEQDGARLTLIDPARDWGWQIVNHAKYRERARLASKNERDVETGKNAERMGYRRNSPETAGDRREPPLTDPSYKTIQDIDKSASDDAATPAKKVSRAKKPALVTIPDDFTLTPELAAYIAQHLPDADADALMADYRAKAQAKAWTYANWSMAFQTYCRNAKPDSGHFSAGQYPKRRAMAGSNPLNPHAHLVMR
jgi:hypothetical protein